VKTDWFLTYFVFIRFRDRMHKSCLREWLVQQQTCPTCRGDISAMEARQRQQNEVDARIQEERHRHQAEEESKEETDVSPTRDDGATADDRSREPHLTLEESGDASTRTQGSTPAFPQLASDADQNLSTSNAGRGKRVRIATPESTTGPLFGNNLSSCGGLPAFPAFYRVVQDAGSCVYNDGETVSFPIRIVPFGVVVLGQEMAWRHCDGESRLMIQIPDGWICDDDLERIVAVPFEP
jgi:E3 ubiquitin-protein ligase synoviolin